MRGELRREDRAAMLLDSPAGRRFFNALDALGMDGGGATATGLRSEGDRWPVPFNTRARTLTAAAKATAAMCYAGLAGGILTDG
jgi:hypothetical protein